MGALPGTLGGQLWGEGTIEPPSHGSPAIQSRFEVPRSKECPALTSGGRGFAFVGMGRYITQVIEDCPLAKNKADEYRAKARGLASMQ